MRFLKPEIAKARKEKILRWVIQQFVETRRPVGSQMIADGALQDVSSATVRNIMKELEEEGYLYQPHTSGGRIPTDKAYRYYVDYLANVQKMAARERQRIEEQYDARVNEVDNMLVQTSRLLAMLSGAAGFVYTAHVADQRIRRLDFIPVAPGLILAVLVTEAGAVRHWPVRTGYVIEPSRLRVLSRFINEEISGLPLAQARELAKRLKELSRVRVCGYMAIAPQGAQTAELRRLFAQLKQAFDEDFAPGQERYLSLGMSQDFETAVEEGSSLPRIGSKLFADNLEGL